MCIKIDFNTGKRIEQPPTNGGKGNDFSRFYALLKQMPFADKEQLVFDNSGGKTTSLKEFSESNPKAYNTMLNDMQRALTGRKKALKLPTARKQKNAVTAHLFSKK